MASIDQETIANLKAIRADPDRLAAMSAAQLEDLKALHWAALREDLFYWAECVAHHFCKPHHDPTPAHHHRLILYWLNELSKWDGTGNVGIKRLMIWMRSSASF